MFLNNLQISRENTGEICEIFKNTYSEEHEPVAASMGRLFRKAFQMQSSSYSSRLKAVMNHVRNYKKPRFY